MCMTTSAPKGRRKSGESQRATGANRRGYWAGTTRVGVRGGAAGAGTGAGVGRPWPPPPFVHRWGEPPPAAPDPPFIDRLCPPRNDEEGDEVTTNPGVITGPRP